jgi:hypothetical protein
MGVDISSHSGVVLTAEQLARIVNEGNRELACRTLIRFAATLLRSITKEDDETESDDHETKQKRTMINFLVARFRSLSTTTSLEALQQMLQEMAQGVADGFDSYVTNSDEAMVVWGELISVLHPNAPKPGDTEYIDSPRYQGWDLPQGKVLFVFSEDDCFERVKTGAGRALDEMIGETTELSWWTTYSV